MNKKIRQGALEITKVQVRELIETLTKDMPDDLYIETLEEIEADVSGMLECKKEEMESPE